MLVCLARCVRVVRVSSCHLSNLAVYELRVQWAGSPDYKVSQLLYDRGCVVNTTVQIMCFILF